MQTFTLTIVSDSKTRFNGPALYCSVTTLSGSMGFEANHEPFLCTLKEGSAIQVKDAASKETEITIANGMLSFKNNSCIVTVLTT